MKRFILSTLLIFAAVAAYAQTSTIKGSLVDSYSDEGVIGAIVEIVPVDASREPVLTTSGYDGAFTFNSVRYGEYVIKASYMGYHDFADTIKVNSPRLILEKLRIKESATEIDAVVKEVQAMRTSQRGDTLSYSASAYKVAGDADVEGLLKKMPGITVTDGEVTAQGETIQKIYIDGREFFGNDVTTAISTLPAEMVENVEVYDKLSDNAELSGMDDGEGYKAINIVTKANMRQGFFGKMYAGGGYQPEVEGDMSHYKYMAGGNVNYFTGKHRFSLIGLFNNINQQSFSFDDILGVTDSRQGASKYMVRPQAGVANVGALGLNYSGTFGANDKVKVEGSYFYNGTDTYNYKTVDKWYEEPLAADTLHSETVSQTPNYNHRFTGRVEWKITPTQQVTLRQSASLQYNDGQSTATGAMWGESGYSLIDNYSLNDKGGYSSYSSLSYASRLGKAGRTISANANLWLSAQDNETYSYSNAAAGYTDAPVSAVDTAAVYAANPLLLRDLYYTAAFSPTQNTSLSANITYAEPVAKSAQVTLKYAFSNKYQDTEKNTYSTDPSYLYDPVTDWQSASSNHYETTYITHQVGPGFYYSNGKSKLSANVNYQLSELSGDVVLAGADKTSEPIEHTFSNVTYGASGQLYFNPTNSLRFKLNGKTSEPWVGRLADAYSLSNVQYISHGNPNLTPSYNTMFRMFYVRSNIEKGSTFMIMGGLDNQQDYIGEHVLYYPGSFEVDGESYSPIEYSTYVNLDEYWSYRAMMEYGFPIGFLKSNFNIRGSASYTLTPSMFGGILNTETGLIDGGEQNNNSNMTYGLTTVLGSNISENVDFTLSWNGSYSEAVNSAAKSDEVNTYLSQTAAAMMKFVLPLDFTFTGSAVYNDYKGITNDYHESYVVCNAFIGKKIFKNRRGELNFGVNDIFNQNTSFARSVGTGFTQNTYNSVIGRYFSVQLVYNLRSFGGKQGGGGHRGPGPGMGRHHGMM